MSLFGNILLHVAGDISVPVNRSYRTVYRIDNSSRTVYLHTVARSRHMDSRRIVVQYDSRSCRRIVVQQNIIEQSARLDNRAIGIHIVVDHTIGNGKRVGHDHGRTVFGSGNVESVQFGPIIYNRSGSAVVVRTDNRHPFGRYRKFTLRCILLQQARSLRQFRFVSAPKSAVDFHIGHPLQSSRQCIIATGNPHSTVGTALVGITRIVGRIDGLLQIAHSIVPTRTQTETVGFHIQIGIEKPLIFIRTYIYAVPGDTTAAGNIDKHYSRQRIANSQRLIDRSERIVSEQIGIPFIVHLFVVDIAYHISESCIDEFATGPYAILAGKRIALIGSFETRAIRHIFVLRT